MLMNIDTGEWLAKWMNWASVNKETQRLAATEGEAHKSCYEYELTAASAPKVEMRRNNKRRDG